MSRSKFRAVVLGAATCALVLSTPAGVGNTTVETLSAPPPDKIQIKVVATNGSGCPAGTANRATVVVSPDNTAFTVTYSDYMAKQGPGIPATDFRKNCQLGLRVFIPQGFTYAVARADYRGFYSLAKGSRAQQHARYYFTGTTPTAETIHRFAAPREDLADDYIKSDTVDAAFLVWAPCGKIRDLQVNTELRVFKGTSSANATNFIAMDSTDGSIETKYHFSWKRC